MVMKSSKKKLVKERVKMLKMKTKMKMKKSLRDMLEGKELRLQETMMMKKKKKKRKRKKRTMKRMKRMKRMMKMTKVNIYFILIEEEVPAAKKRRH